MSRRPSRLTAPVVAPYRRGAEQWDRAEDAVEANAPAAPPRSLTARDVISLQRLAGNRSVAALLAGGRPAVVQRAPKKGATPPPGRLELDGLPALPVLSATWGAKSKVKPVYGGRDKFPQLVSSGVDVGNLVLTRRPDKASSALQAWLHRGMDEDAPLDGVLHLVPSAKGGGLGPGTLEFTQARLVSMTAGEPEKLELSLGGSYKLSGSVDKAVAAKASARLTVVGGGWTPLPVLSWTLRDGQPSQMAPKPTKPTVANLQPVTLAAQVPLGPMVGRLTDAMSEARAFNVTLEHVKGGAIVMLRDAIVTEVNVGTARGSQGVSVVLTAEQAAR